MKKEFVVERQGRLFVLYAGLLDEAHAQGLKSISTTLIQSPNESNNYVAICQAVVETEKGRFSGIGDASPTNVAGAMANCTIRMAETRAKARALRDAVNVGVAALEELAEEDYGEPQSLGASSERLADSPRSNGHQSNGQHYDRPAVYNASAGPSQSAMATAAQVRAIYLIARDQHSLGESQIEERSVATYGCTPAELTKKQASEFISALRSAPKR
ncbi:MAG: hypothetical protein M1358_17080 [Chloroflexi bacterium]|nr:hypothetical protein [Chloroflexota bacterium]